ncbi:histone-lysine n-methyltransferase [Lichtheimia corymbifera JMRC:FSU:9682]|uniref:SET domain-containing protein 2 n=1 Tax=Lichtheimia corymbifera JMRC:FSU:9682 TaxID=1263082 RepID=A0A068RH85_9FUNG|nr:histone-lysine n-methyltransferase [Lichtheimia corymbifera JMRC:FSU:9682]
MTHGVTLISYNCFPAHDKAERGRYFPFLNPFPNSTTIVIWISSVNAPNHSTICLGNRKANRNQVLSDMPNNASSSDSNTVVQPGSESTRHGHMQAFDEGRSEEDQIPNNNNNNNSNTTTTSTHLKPQSHATNNVDTTHLPSATAEAMGTYGNISQNIYCGTATGRSIASESMPCECKYDPDSSDPDEACGDDNTCINRMMFMECLAEHCPSDRYCRNRRFQLRQYARVDVIRTELKGYGLRALADLPANAFIMEYIGEVIPYKEFIRRTKIYEKEGVEHYYFMTLKNDEIIDATRKGCLARFINHSCNPNSVTQKWVVGKSMRIGLFTMRPVKAGEELTFDYKFERYGATAQPCYCGEPNCKGYIGASSSQEEEELTGQFIEPEEDIDEEDLRSLQPLHDVEQVKSFVKKMLDSIGNASLVNKLLDCLDLTNPENSVGKEVLKRFVRLHGLKMLKCWLSEWKYNDEIIEKVLRILGKLPLANRNGLDDCKMFDVVRKFTDSESQEISTRSTELLEAWSELKEVYRIPKRVYVENEVEDVTESGTEVDADHKEIVREKAASKKSKYNSTRAFFDPDDDFYEYIPLATTDAEINSIMRYPPRPAIPTAPRAMLEYTAMMNDNSYGWYHYPTYNYYDNSYPGCYVLQDLQYAYMASLGSEAYNQGQVTQTAQTEAADQGNTAALAGQDPTAPSTSGGTTSNGAETRKLPANWQKAVTDAGDTYYYNTITKVSQWEFPEEKVSSIEGVDKNQLDDLVKQAVERKRQQTSSISPANSVTGQTPRVVTPAASTSGSNEVEGGGSHGMDEVDLKREVGKVVTKYLTVKQQALWKGDKHLFKELARKLTHHVVDRETQSKRKIVGMTGALRAKIEKFIDMHGNDFALKIQQTRQK